MKAHPLPKAEKLQKLYEENPSNILLKQLTIACAPYFSSKKNLNKMVDIFNSLPFNYQSHRWAEINFDRTYKARWVPKKIPTMIFSGDKDYITPLKLFSESQEFQRENILIREIKNASHFPWIDEPKQVREVFAEYCRSLI